MKNQAAVLLGRLGGARGGVARARSLSAEQRSEIASTAARARWANHSTHDLLHVMRVAANTVEQARGGETPLVAALRKWADAIEGEIAAPRTTRREGESE